MLTKFKSVIAKTLSKLGITVFLNSSISDFLLIRNSEINELKHSAKSIAAFQFLSESELLGNLPVKQASEYVLASKSQLGQDVLALSYVGTYKPGYFVEFGATNGRDLSNTYLLEKHFGWKGILCEPAKIWHKELFSNRESIIDTRCVFNSTGEQLDFLEATTSHLSTIEDFAISDSHRREMTEKYKVTTVTLGDLLTEHNAPHYINFLSIDTEGSEYLILRDFDFEKYQFGLICVEHNFTENRSRIFDLLSSKGYKRVFEDFSAWDDWYVKVG